MFPLLTEEGFECYKQKGPRGGIVKSNNLENGPFVYQSCSGRREPPFTFQGELIMVKESIASRGEAFEVRVAPFLLDTYQTYF